jgi:hypothetical protein
MSIEAALAENTSAIKELIGVWAKLLAQGKSINARVESGEVESVMAGAVKVAVATPAKKVEPPKPVDALTGATAPAGPTSTTTDTKSTAEVTYEEVKKAINAAVEGGQRDKVMAALTTFGVKKGPELKPEQWAAFVEAVA